MPRQVLDVDNSDALNAIGQVSEALRGVARQLQQIKTGLSDISGGTGGVGGSSPTYFEQGNASAASALPGGGINLAGLPIPGRLFLNGVLQNGAGAAGAAGVNPSIVAAQNQSVTAGNNATYYRDAQGRFTSPSAMAAASSAAAPTGVPQTTAGGGTGSNGGNPLNPFAGAAPNGPSSSIGTPYQFAYNQWLAGQQATANFRLAAGTALLHGGAQIANAYTQSVVSGSPNQLGFGGAYGGIAGGIAGGYLGGIAAGAAAGSIVPGLGTLIGAGLGATVGAAGVNALQAPYIATLNTKQASAPTAARLGVDTGGLAAGANEIAGVANETFASRNGFFNGIKDRVLRATHFYSGDDVVSQQDVADTRGALDSANLANGTALSSGSLYAATARFTARYKGESAAIARALAPALSRARANGNNLADLVDAAGLEATTLFARDRGDNAGADALGRGYGGVLDARYAFESAQSVAAGAAADYSASSLGGRSFRQRSGAFATSQAGIQGEIGAVDAQITTETALPGGGSSNKVKALNALKKQLYAEIAHSAEAQAGGVLSDAFGGGAVATSAANIGLTRATLYGNGSSFAGAGKGLLNALSGEEQSIRSALQDPNLSYQDRQRGQGRLNDIANQRLLIPAQVAGASLHRNLLGADVRVAQAGVGYNVAGAYGSDAQVGQTALGGIQAQQGTIDAANSALRDPNLSAEDRANAQLRIAGAQNAQLQLRIVSRDTLLGRIAGRAGVSEGAAGLALTKASVLGSGSDVRAASAGLVGSFGEEQKQIQAQLNAGGLTVEQELRLKGRLNSIGSDIFGAQQNALDQGYAKDDLSGYTTPSRKIQGQLERLQYLPFSASNPIKLSIEAINLNNKQVGVLNSREQELRKSGNLSPERADAIEAQRQALETQSAAATSTINEGFIDRLPALAAGRPSFGAKFTSVSMAAAQISLMHGNPIRSFGANNGDQLRTQDDAIRAAGGTPEMVAPHSRMSGLDNAGQNDRLAAAIEHLVQVLGGAAGARPTGCAPVKPSAARSPRLPGAIQGHEARVTTAISHRLPPIFVEKIITGKRVYLF